MASRAHLPWFLCAELLVTPQALLRASMPAPNHASVASVVRCVSSPPQPWSLPVPNSTWTAETALAEAACSGRGAHQRRRQKTLQQRRLQLPLGFRSGSGRPCSCRACRACCGCRGSVIRAPPGSPAGHHRSRGADTTGGAIVASTDRQQRRQPRQLLLSSELDLGWLGLSRVSLDLLAFLWSRDKLADRATQSPQCAALCGGTAAADSSCLLPAKAKSLTRLHNRQGGGFRQGAHETEDLKRNAGGYARRLKANASRPDDPPKERHLDPLPEGWFFNGTKYISFDGESSKMHPSLEKFLESHIAEENKKIAEYNAKLAAGSDV
uniref:MBD domain-containing protein n=1 Tax=Macrostomum lignano TaxID=282301 RepID=A0A1I8FCH6_9PLAT